MALAPWDLRGYHHLLVPLDKPSHQDFGHDHLGGDEAAIAQKPHVQDLTGSASQWDASVCRIYRCHQIAISHFFVFADAQGQQYLRCRASAKKLTWQIARRIFYGSLAASEFSDNGQPDSFVYLSTTWRGVHVACCEASIPGEVAPLAVVLSKGGGGRQRENERV